MHIIKCIIAGLCITGLIGIIIYSGCKIGELFLKGENKWL